MKDELCPHISFWSRDVILCQFEFLRAVHKRYMIMTRRYKSCLLYTSCQNPLSPLSHLKSSVRPAALLQPDKMSAPYSSRAWPEMCIRDRYQVADSDKSYVDNERVERMLNKALTTMIDVYKRQQ